MGPNFSADLTRVSGRRYVAHLADSVLLSIAWVIVLIPAALISNVLLVIGLILGITVWQVAYFVLTQRGGDQSPGKRVVGIRVVDAQGRTPSAQALFLRSVPLLIEYFYVIAWLAMMFSPYRQRFGDRWADTFVVEA